MNRTFLSVTAIAAIGVCLGNVAVCSSAHAQSWSPDRQYTEGAGIKLGDLEVHPGVAIRGGYDTNVFKADGDTGAGSAGQDIVGSGILAVTPHLNISTQSKQRAQEGESGSAPVTPPTIALRAGLAASYFYYFESTAPKNLEVDTDIWLGILPERPVNLELSAAYQRTTRPFTQNGTDSSNNAFATNSVRPGARVNFGSRSQVLTAYVGYVPNISIYQGEDFKYLSGLGHNVDAGSAWKFLPHTALLYDANLELFNYFDDSPSTPPPILVSDSARVKTRLGLNGALTQALTLRIMAGYAVGFYDEPLLSEFEDVIGEATLGYKFTNTNKLEVGYTRDVQGAATGGWVRTDRGAAKLGLGFGGSFALGFEAGYGYLTYGRMLAPDGTGLGTGANPDERTDSRVDGAIRAEYRVTNWLAFMADATVQATFTDFEYAVPDTSLVDDDGDPSTPPTVDPNAAPFPDPAGYVSFQFFGGLRAHY